MNLQEFFNSCNLNIDVDKVDYIPEFLIDNKPDCCYLIDALPMVVSKKYGYKFSQLEDELYNHNFYMKFYNVLKKLWLYDDLFFYSELLNSKKTRKHIPKSKTKLYKKLLNDDNEITEVEVIDFLNDLSEKNVIDLEYYFKDFKIYITPSFNCVFVFVNDKKEFDILNDFVKSEGLFIRKA